MPKTTFKKIGVLADKNVYQVHSEETPEEKVKDKERGEQISASIDKISDLLSKMNEILDKATTS